jgi:hypothetical protein
VRGYIYIDTKIASEESKRSTLTWKVGRQYATTEAKGLPPQRFMLELVDDILSMGTRDI